MLRVEIHQLTGDDAGKVVRLMVDNADDQAYEAGGLQLVDDLVRDALINADLRIQEIDEPAGAGSPGSDRGDDLLDGCAADWACFACQIYRCPMHEDYNLGRADNLANVPAECPADAACRACPEQDCDSRPQKQNATYAGPAVVPGHADRP